MPFAIRTSLSDYLALPENTRITELLDGSIRMTPPPTDRHQQTLGAFYSYLRIQRPDGVLRFAPTGIQLDEENFVAPDLFWIRPDSPDCVLKPDQTYWRGIPDLIVAVMSPATALSDKRDKQRLYDRCGLGEYWLVAPEGRYVEVYQRQHERLSHQGVFSIDDQFHSVALDIDIDVQAAFHA